MTHFVRNGNNITVMADGAMDVSDRLTTGHYAVRTDGFNNLFLEQIKSFELPAKMYGDIEKTSARIIHTFNSRPNNTGVLLVGEKGSGKTLLAKFISISCERNDIPTILINQQFGGEALNSLLSRIEQPCVVLFDEFEKTYPGGSDGDDSQENLLTLLDGVYNTKKLFILTCNNEYAIDQHMINRPGRIFYYKKFKGLDNSFIEEYIDDELRLNFDDEKNLQFKKELCYFIRLMGTVNFDMLKAIVEESNRYQSSVSDIFDMLNVGSDDNSYYEAWLHMVGEDEEYEIQMIKSPLKNAKGFTICLDNSYDEQIIKVRERRERKKLPTRFTFNPSQVTKVEKDGTMHFENENGHKIYLKKVRHMEGGYRSVGYSHE